MQTPMCHLEMLSALHGLMQGVERVGARQSPPPPLPLVATVVSTAVAEGHDEKESGDVRASSIAAKVI